MAVRAGVTGRGPLRRHPFLHGLPDVRCAGAPGLAARGEQRGHELGAGAIVPIQRNAEVTPSCPDAPDHDASRGFVRSRTSVRQDMLTGENK